MPASIGVNLRVTGHCRQGGRKYMEDFFSVAYQQTEDERDLEYAFFGIYDGHGGAEAAAFAKERLMETIVRHKFFWSDNDEDVLRAIKMGYVATHYAMWKEQEKWPKTASGLPSTAGTTASIAFIRRGKIYIGHVGDSAIVLGYQEPGCSAWKAKPLTRDHKPESAIEMTRIEQCGGKVIAKSGVPRVVWNRPRIGHKGPVRRSTPIDEIPFLAVARSLGDLWSYNSELNEFVVSPDPDCSVIPIDTSMFRCLIFGTDGLYNMLSPQMAVHIVQQAEKHNEEAALSDSPNKIWLNPSKCLVERALKLWSTTKIRADNTSVVTLMLDPPGPPRAQVLRNRKKSYPDSGLQIMTRYQNESPEQPKNKLEQSDRSPVVIPEHNPQVLQPITSYRINNPSENRMDDNIDHNKSFILKPRESLGFDPTDKSDEPQTDEAETKVSDKSSNTIANINESKEDRCSNCKKASNDASEVSTSSSDLSRLNSSEESIQINEISSSSNEIEDEETTATEKENFSKTNFRKAKVRSSMRNLAKKSDKLEVKVQRTRKRRLADPSESNEIKKMKGSDNVKSKHNLRVRNVIENITKKNEEMVNQVDSTNKELNRKRRRGDRNDVNSNRIEGINAVRKIRKSQRLNLKSKPKMKNKLNKAEMATNLTKQILLIGKKSSKPNKQIKEAVSSSNKSTRRISGKKDAPPSKGDKLKGVTASRKKRSRTFKVGYLKKLRRHVTRRNQTK